MVKIIVIRKWEFHIQFLRENIYIDIKNNHINGNVLKYARFPTKENKAMYCLKLVLLLNNKRRGQVKNDFVICQ